MQGPEVRIVVVGNTGSGKTTLARRVAEALDIPRVELDALNWEPNWTPAPTEVFRARAKEATNGPSWVVDGNYSAVRDIVWARATTLVWLDYPLRTSLWRLWWRTLRRLWDHQELWSGNRESFRNAFMSRESLFVWAITTHGRRQVTYEGALRQLEYAHLKALRFRSPGETEAWLRGLLTGPSRSVWSR